MARPYSDEEVKAAVELFYKNEKNYTAMERCSGGAISKHRARRLIEEAKRRGLLEKPIEFTPVSVPSEDIPVDELLDRRRKQFIHKQRYEEATKLISVNVTLDGPIGILHFGDPHIDDDGTDIIQLEQDVALVKRTEGMLGANVGDTTNNWVGRLATQWANQSTSARESYQLAEWFLTQFRWLYVIGGNHDLWPGYGVSPVEWISKQTESLYKSSEVRMKLLFPNQADIRINARHDFSGHSMYNPAHGAMKSLMFGVRDHLATCGHRHVSGYGVMKDPDGGITMHAIQIASYKIYDRYAKEKGFRDQSLSPCCVTVIDPYLDPLHPDLVKVFWDAEEGADFLTYKRKRWKKKWGQQ